MTNLKMTAIQQLKGQLRQESLRAVIVRHCDCTEKELYSALTSVMEFAGRTNEELKYFAGHGHFPTTAGQLGILDLRRGTQETF